MVKINITIEGEDLEEISSELIKVAGSVLKSNKKLIREILEIFGEEAINVLMEEDMLDKGGELYTEIMHSINWQLKDKK
ncbi:MAG: hypothetical protein V5A68_05725 [Candidatus Thermoplasmatota archaeon]